VGGGKGGIGGRGGEKGGERREKNGKGGIEKEGKEEESGGMEEKEEGRGSQERKKGEYGGSRGRKRREGEARVEKGLGIAFWNVAGLGNKDRDFWESLKKWDVMILIETWTEEKGWGKIKERFPRGYVWRMQGAKRKKKREGQWEGW